MALSGKKIAFIGAGSMAEAIIRGLLQREMVQPNQITVMNRSNTAQLETLQERYKINTAAAPQDKEEAIRQGDLIVLAMKPKDVRQAFAEFSGFLSSSQLLVSVVAGLSLDTMALLLPEGMSVARTMPNTSSTIGMGATGICFSATTSTEQMNMVAAMFEAIGEVSKVTEDQMNWVNGISGSGPAYVYYFMEAMIQAGKDGGLSPELARELTIQTVWGAAAMVKATGEEPAELRRKVTSPNGTTQAAIEVFEQLGLRQAVAAGINRCVERAAEIGDQISQDVKKT